MTTLALPCHYSFAPARSVTLEKEAEFCIERVEPHHRKRLHLQQFIASTFFDTYGAEVCHFCDTLIGCCDQNGQWVAALGFTYAKDGRAFLEQYLDAPLEEEIASRIGVPVSRMHIVEVGNLAATHVGAARKLIVYMTQYLYQQRMVWVAFTATRSLLNSFTRLRLNPTVLIEADPRRLPDAGKNWGSYYATKPQVMFGDIHSGYAQLAK